MLTNQEQAMAQQGQSYGTTAGTSNLGASAMESTDFVLPLKSRQRSFRLGIGLVLVGMTTTIFGAACYADHIFNVLSFSGINIWGGMLVSKISSIILEGRIKRTHYRIL